MPFHWIVPSPSTPLQFTLLLLIVLSNSPTMFPSVFELSLQSLTISDGESEC